jgi:hypothetical protein
MGKQKFGNEFFWISYILFFGMTEKIIKIYVLDIPKCSFIILYSR